MMDRRDIYRAWAPDTSPWSDWAKPVSFIGLSAVDADETTDPALADLPWAPSAGPGVALVVDLPGGEAVDVGLALARRGFRPVPLFNGCPGPRLGAAALVNTAPIEDALRAGAPLLARLDLPPDAPPAFLLDATRRAEGSAVLPGRFDNRWCVVPQDLPSAARLAQAGVRRVLVRAPAVAGDLAHVLHAYQRAGLPLQLSRPDRDHADELRVARPSGFGIVFYRLMVFAGLRRNAAGGFGAVVPLPSASHHGHG